MLIKSYVVFPEPGKSNIVTSKLRAIDGCEVHAAENSELLVLATESFSTAEEAEKEKMIESITEIKSTALVFGNAVDDRVNLHNAGIENA